MQNNQVTQAEKKALTVDVKSRLIEGEIPAGIYSDVDDRTYHGGPGISKSGLDLINRSPLHYKTVKDNPRPSTDPMRVGQAIHCLALEPDTFDDRFVKSEYSEFRTKASKEWRAAQELAGRHVLKVNDGSDFWKVSEWNYVQAVVDSLRSDPFASILLNPEDGLFEHSAYWVDPEYKRLCKCRPDFLNLAHNLCVDLKTTEDASFTGFGKSAASYRYHVQDQFYTDGLYHAGAQVSGFVFVAVEKTPPYAVACYVLDDEAKRVGRAQYRENLRVYSECRKRELWPGYPGTDIFTLGLRSLEIAPWGLKGNVS